jgi:hypothetical protein
MVERVRGRWKEEGRKGEERRKRGWMAEIDHRLFFLEKTKKNCCVDHKMSLSASSSSSSMMAEVDEIVKRISSRPGVSGLVVATRTGVSLRSTFQDLQAAKYSSLFSDLLESATKTLTKIDPQVMMIIFED